MVLSMNISRNNPLQFMFSSMPMSGNGGTGSMNPTYLREKVAAEVGKPTQEKRKIIRSQDLDQDYSPPNLAFCEFLPEVTQRLDLLIPKRLAELLAEIGQYDQEITAKTNEAESNEETFFEDMESKIDSATDIEQLAPLLDHIEAESKRLQAARDEIIEDSKQNRLRAQEAYDLVDPAVNQFDEDKRALEADLEASGRAKLERVRAARAEAEQRRRDVAAAAAGGAQAKGVVSSAAQGGAEGAAAAATACQRGGEGGAATAAAAAAAAAAAKPKRRQYKRKEDKQAEELERQEQRLLQRLFKKEDIIRQNIEEDKIDPNEPTYCHCKQVSYGEMVCCENSECETEWFHFPCVGLKSQPQGSW
eukprot:CAMPEP_0194574162 /NCGR_PEP_ID=MMETSP0292-20121207/10126_1 /TAXON_ID=39354 /ORGANISM="Heterosigma akashiwo, Strain CCMP2393" /LENGTH=361 /DNA_ID=CAMNT_0039425633 /DNA_START=127 /DNA_END=1209 /DNA_ORIENTATION=+